MPKSSAIRRGWRWATPLAVCVLALGASTAVAAEPPDDPPSAAESLLNSLPPLPERPNDLFYTPPGDLPNGEPGDVIKQREISSPLLPNAAVHQVMYLSKNQQGELVPVTGVLLAPREPLSTQNSDADPLVALTPGTRGLGDHCAPSMFFNPTTTDPRQPDYEYLSYQEYLSRGISVVITDYLGGGTPLKQEYLVGKSEGQNGLDAARAAQRLDPNDDLTESSPVGLSGFSQGGQAAAWAAELQPSYGPELNLKGVVVDAPPVDLIAQLDHLNGNPVAAGAVFAAVLGIDAAYPELNLQQYITPFGEKVYDRVRQACVAEEAVAFGTTSVGDTTHPDVSTLPAFRAALGDSQLGTKKPGAPSYIYHGSNDVIVPVDFGRALYSAWCAKGASTRFTLLPGQEHFSGNIAGTPQAVAWMAARLAGKPAEQGCHEGQQVSGIG